MKQYNAIKAKYPDALLLFRVGDFYETFGSDAITASSILGIVLTRRANGAASYVELAGFPHHSLDTYLPKLVRAGHRVAICDQLEDPKLAKTIVKRGVTELVTPGVSYNDKVLENKQNNFLASIHLQPKNNGIAFLDISTGEFLIAQGNEEYIDKLLQTFKPSEVIIQKSKKKIFFELFGDKFYINTFEDWVFTRTFGEDLLLRHFNTLSLKGFGIEDMNSGIIAAGASLHYLAETHHDKVQHISHISRIEEDHYVWLDKFTVRNLEILNSPNEQATTLLHVMDQTVSPMGSRMMRRWLVLPLKEKKPVNDRLDAVEYLLNEPAISEELRLQLKAMGDMERIISKVAVGRINPREVLQLKRALHALEPVKTLCSKAPVSSLNHLADQINLCTLMSEKIGRELKSDPPVAVSKGNVMASGISAELDEFRELTISGKEYLARMQQRESERTGIPSLKIAFNNVFGYYLEVTNTHKDKVPPEWERKQTLVNSERYVTPELKEYESKILNAQERMLELETNLYNNLISSLFDYIQPIQNNAAAVARLDCLLSFARVAETNNYRRPVITEDFTLEIKKGRHPVIEKHLPVGEEYIANDVFLDDQKQQIIMITGPNMSGKSALLRQTALIVLLAQAGSFVPAEAASIGLVDKIFTRVGASDNISSGESTFMVEMNETASILNNISDRSLILLDEIGRGTSTYDGISIAWAITEYLHEHPLYRAKVLFATHYHELNEMTQTLPRIKNYHISVKEVGNKVIFMRKLEPGGSEHSFGIHVARMAGIPTMVLDRAHELLKVLENSHGSGQLQRQPGRKTGGKRTSDPYQLSFIQLNDPLLEQIRDDILDTDINTLTPVEALLKLNEIKKLLKKT
ncbi:MAG: DNA mismatch repair protein MutS [Lentimicrobium sp.]|nr:DNA mismatch repair protein MutS [Lentimicrobium sp.]MDD2526919.1 DNA mismatch repair protein MutS [Lentimicrobiaceae bacterium]MDD4598142.1 DNA mismatch repair protein MutS [Lentimicrobiaceae bacterium]MDY0025220.1 DNA mismatch repair protein MutS [Lentimicrobium sp.]HAH59366.1 DNA mismatch repair protein MutS [Bacteroidales bacterium]